MIEFATETILSFSEAVQLLPRRRGQKKPHVSTLYRWSVNGCKGIVLESIQIGATRCTSKQALERFFKRLTQQNGPPVLPIADAERMFTPRRRQRQIEQAHRELEAEGM